MLKVTDIIPDVTKSIGTQLWLLDVRPYYKYDNGIRSTAVEGYKYTIAAIDKGLAKLDVKIPGVQLMDAPEKYLPVRSSPAGRPRPSAKGASITPFCNQCSM